MKISKHVHSCLLVEENNTTVLFDPGNYTYDEKALNINSLQKLDYIVITHEHADHMYVPLIKEVIGKFPSVKIISNESVKKSLAQEGIDVSTQEDEVVKLQDISHERLFDKEVPQNSHVTLFNRLSNPGDSYQQKITTEILTFPIQAPWGSYVTAIEKIKELQPKIVIPIHDWHWKDEVRKSFYTRAAEYLKQFNIDFKSVETGERIEV